MIRYSAFDPPEYVHWQADQSILEEYRNTIERDPRRREIIHTLTPSQLLAIYQGLVRNRLHDIALKRWVKQGVISKAWLGTGEEAATVGPVHALRAGMRNEGVRNSPEENSSLISPHSSLPGFVAPMIRNSGACSE